MELFNVSEGNIYLATYRVEAKANNGTISISFTTPSRSITGTSIHKQIAVYPFFSASGADFAGCDLYILEDAASWANGSAGTWVNMSLPAGAANGPCDMLSVADVKGGFTKDSDADEGVEVGRIAAGHGEIGGKFLAELRTPFILQPGKDYTFIVTSDTADTTLWLGLIAQQKEI